MTITDTATTPQAPKPPTKRNPHARLNRWLTIIAGVLATLIVGVWLGNLNDTEAQDGTGLQAQIDQLKTRNEQLRTTNQDLNTEIQDLQAAATDADMGEPGIPGTADEPAAEPEPEPNPAIVDEPEPDPTVMQIGDGFTFAQDGSEAGSVTISGLKRTTQPYDSYGSGPKNNTFLIFSIRVEATAQIDIYDDDFYIVTRDGERIDHGDDNAYDAVDYDDMLGWAELNAGQHKTGVLVFDSPAKHGTLVYDPNYEGEPIASWEF